MTIREFQLQHNTIKQGDLPVFIKKYDKYVYVLISYEQLEQYSKALELDPIRLHRENELLKKYMSRSLKLNVSQVLEQAEFMQEDSEPLPEPQVNEQIARNTKEYAIAWLKGKGIV